MRKISLKELFYLKKFMIQANIPANKAVFSSFKTKASFF